MAILIAPSILSADFRKLEKELQDVEAAGADMIHVDVMDGHFVPNITVGPMIVRAVKSATRLPIDVHLMIEYPERYVEAFADAGADLITVHPETGYHLLRTLQAIKDAGKKAGIALNPATPLSAVEEAIALVDLLLVMSVNPGFGGQEFIPSMAGKIARSREMIEKSGRSIDLQVDGGIKAENAAMVVRQGANVLVMGTEIFRSGDYRAKIAEVRAAIARESV